MGIFEPWLPGMDLPFGEQDDRKVDAKKKFKASGEYKHKSRPIQQTVIQSQKIVLCLKTIKSSAKSQTVRENLPKFQPLIIIKKVIN